MYVFKYLLKAYHIENFLSGNSIIILSLIEMI